MERSTTGRKAGGDGRTRRNRRGPRFVRPFVALGLVLALGVGAHAEAAGKSVPGGRLYRYKNEQGRIEIANSVPADRAAAGYEVLDANGQVLETVSAQLTPEQLAEKEARDREANACRQNVDRVMALYGTTHDIDAAAEQAQRSLEGRIANLEASLALERRRLEERESEAAQRERTGRAVSRDLVQDIEHSRTQIEAIGVEIDQRRKEQDDAKDQFAADRRYFETGACDAGFAQSAN